jgi:hypothetical protein
VAGSAKQRGLACRVGVQELCLKSVVGSWEKSSIIRIVLGAGSDDASALVSLWRAWGPAASLLVAALAVVISLSQARSARKALQLSLRQDAQKSARLDLIVKDSALWALAGSGRRFVGVRICCG